MEKCIAVYAVLSNKLFLNSQKEDKMELIRFGSFIGLLSFTLFFFSLSAYSENWKIKMPIAALTYFTAIASMLIMGTEAVKEGSIAGAIFCFAAAIFWPFIWWVYLSPVKALSDIRQNERSK